MTRTQYRLATEPKVLVLVCLVLPLVLAILAPISTSAQGRLSEFLDSVEPDALVGAPTVWARPWASSRWRRRLQPESVVGFVYLNSDFVDSVGYSGKPIHILAGIDREARITGVELVAHAEPIVLIGIPEERVVDAIGSLIGTDIAAVSAGEQPLPQVDIVSGATVTVLVMGESVLRAGITVLRSGRLAELAPEDGAAVTAAAPGRSIREEAGEALAWEDLIGDGSCAGWRCRSAISMKPSSVAAMPRQCQRWPEWRGPHRWPAFDARTDAHPRLQPVRRDGMGPNE